MSMRSYAPRDPHWETRVRESFAKQGAMASLGARITALNPGECTIELPFRPELSQQHGFFHAGILSAIADSAGGYAGYTLFPARTEVLTVEFKINFVAPAEGDALTASAHVIRAGRTLTVTSATVHVRRAGRDSLCALMQQTLIALSD